ncbi:MAG: hypothetical protein KAH20_03680 [Methylococcales bacterium]|nr:hypothetical protein [Methylococcales bacterium]
MIVKKLYCGVDEQDALQMAESSEYALSNKNRRGIQGKINRVKQQVKQVDISAAKQMI